MSIAIGDNFELMYPGDDGFVVDDTLVRGGYSIVSNIAERDAIPPSARKEGMIVYVQTPKLEYKLVNGIANTNWSVRNTMIDDGQTFARLDSPHFTGNVTYTSVDTPSKATISKILETYNNDTDITFIEIALTPEEKAGIGMYTAIRGENSSATAIILEVRDNGILIPSKTAPVSKPEYRKGTFIQSEKLIFTAGGVIAHKEEQVVTLAGLNATAISKMGGRLFGQLELRPVYRYVTDATIKSFSTETSLGIAYVRMDFTTKDKQYVHGEMEIEVVNEGGVSDKLTTIRMMTSGNGFVINIDDVTKIKEGRKIKIMTSVTMPQQANHAACKEYVDGIVRPITLQLKAVNFNKIAQAYDPIKKEQRKLARYVISKELFTKEHLPIFKLYVNHVVDSYTYKYEIKDADVRVGLRSLSDTNYELVVEFWGIDPYDCEIHVI